MSEEKKDGKENLRKKKQISEKKKIRNAVADKAEKKREKKKYTSVNEYYDLSDKDDEKDVPDPEQEKAEKERLKRKKALKKSIAVRNFMTASEDNKESFAAAEQRREEETHKSESEKAYGDYPPNGNNVTDHSASGNYGGNSSAVSNTVESYSTGGNFSFGNTSDSCRSENVTDLPKPDAVDRLGAAANVVGSAVQSVSQIEAAKYSGSDIGSASAETFVQTFESAAGFVSNVSGYHREQQIERQKEAAKAAAEMINRQEAEDERKHGMVAAEYKKMSQISEFARTREEEKRQEQSRFDRFYDALMSDVTLPETNDIVNALRSEVRIPVISDIHDTLNTDVSELIERSKMSEQQAGIAKQEKEKERRAAERAEQEEMLRTEEPVPEEISRKETAEKYKDFEKKKDFEIRQRQEKLSAERAAQRKRNAGSYKAAEQRRQFSDDKESREHDENIRREAREIYRRLNEEVGEQSSRIENIEKNRSGLSREKMRKDDSERNDRTVERNIRYAHEYADRNFSFQTSNADNAPGQDAAEAGKILESELGETAAQEFIPGKGRPVGIGSLVGNGGQGAAEAAEAAGQAVGNAGKALSAAGKAVKLAGAVTATVGAVAAAPVKAGKAIADKAAEAEKEMQKGNNSADGAMYALYRPIEKAQEKLKKKAADAVKSKLKRDIKLYRSKHDLLKARNKKLAAQRKWYEEQRSHKAEYYKHEHGMDSSTHYDLKKMWDEFMSHRLRSSVTSGPAAAAAAAAVIPVFIVVIVFVLIAVVFSWVSPFEYVISGETVQAGGDIYVVTDSGKKPLDWLERQADTEKEVINGYLEMVQDYGTLVQAHIYAEYGDWSGGHWKWDEATFSFKEFWDPIAEEMSKTFERDLKALLADKEKKLREEDNKKPAPKDEQEKAEREQAISDALAEIAKEKRENFKEELAAAKKKAEEPYQEKLDSYNDKVSLSETFLPHEADTKLIKNGEYDCKEFNKKPIPGTNFFENTDIPDASANELVAYIAIYQLIKYLNTESGYAPLNDLSGEDGGSKDSGSVNPDGSYGTSPSDADSDALFRITMKDIVEFFNSVAYFGVKADITDGYTCSGCVKVWLHPGETIEFVKTGQKYTAPEDVESLGEYYTFCAGNHSHLTGEMIYVTEDPLIANLISVTGSERHGIGYNEIIELRDSYLDFMSEKLEESGERPFVDHSKAMEYYRVMTKQRSAEYDIVNDNCEFFNYLEFLAEEKLKEEGEGEGEGEEKEGEEGSGEKEEEEDLGYIIYKGSKEEENPNE